MEEERVASVFMDGVDWQHEIEHAAGGNRVYASAEDLKKNSKCWPQCGIVEVEVRLVRWVEDQDFGNEITGESAPDTTSGTPNE
jgi:hypothetical protein